MMIGSLGLVELLPSVSAKVMARANLNIVDVVPQNEKFDVALKLSC